jgi:hypothetical protein
MLLSVGGAWLAAALANPTTGDLHTGNYQGELKGSDRGFSRWTVVPDDWTVRTWQASWGPGLRWDLVSECEWMGSTLGMSEHTNPNRTKAVETCGWPIPCLQRTVWESGAAPGQAGRWATLWREGVPTTWARAPYRGASRRALPLRPVAWALVSNVIVWAGLLAGARGAWVWARTSRRRRRGQCPACGYEQASLAGCPECGRGRDTIGADPA